MGYHQEFQATRVDLPVDGDGAWRLETALRAFAAPSEAPAWNLYGDRPQLEGPLRARDVEEDGVRERVLSMDDLRLRLVRLGDGTWVAHRFETSYRKSDPLLAGTLVPAVVERMGGRLDGFHVGEDGGSWARGGSLLDREYADAVAPVVDALRALTPRDDVHARAGAFLRSGDEGLLGLLAREPGLPPDVRDALLGWAEAKENLLVAWSLLSRGDLPPREACRALAVVGRDGRARHVHGCLLVLLGTPSPTGDPPPEGSRLPRVDDALLDEAERSSPERVVDALHLLPSAPPERLRRRVAHGLFGRAGPAAVEMAARLRPDLPPDLFDAVLAHAPLARHHALLAHPALPRVHVERALEADERTLGMLLQRPDLTPVELARAAEHVLGDPKAGAWIGKRLAAHPALPDDLRVRLLRGPSPTGLLRGFLEGARMDDASFETVLSRIRESDAAHAEHLLIGLLWNRTTTPAQRARIRALCHPGSHAASFAREVESRDVLDDPASTRADLLRMAERMRQEGRWRTAHLQPKLAAHPGWGGEPPADALVPPLPPALRSLHRARAKDPTFPLPRRLESLRLLLAWGSDEDDAQDMAPWLPPDAPHDLLEPLLESAPPAPAEPLAPHAFRPDPTRDQVLLTLWRSPFTPAPLRSRVRHELLALPGLPDAARAAVEASPDDGPRSSGAP